MGSCPFVYWAQDENEVFLRIDLRDSSDVSVSVKNSLVKFRGIGSGAQGRKEYSFSLSLFSGAHLSKSSEEGGSCLQYVLKKSRSEWWPAVTKEPGRISWLRVDFDRFKDPDESDHSDSNSADPARLADEQMSELAKRLLGEEKEGPMPYGDAVQLLKNVRKWGKNVLMYYLFGYNISLFLINFYIIAYLLGNFIAIGPDFLNKMWAEKSSIIILATELQLFDVVHSFLGITKTGSLAVFMQVLIFFFLRHVFGRLTVLYVVDGYSPLHTATSTLFLLVVYFLIEIFRYPYYAVSCLKKEFRIISWLRYNMWVPLYPLGILFEGITAYRAIPYYYSSGKYSIAMPNAANIGFNFGIYLAFLLLALPLIGAYLLTYMFRQRSKKFKNLQKKTQ